MNTNLLDQKELGLTFVAQWLNRWCASLVAQQDISSWVKIKRHTENQPLGYCTPKVGEKQVLYTQSG